MNSCNSAHAPIIHVIFTVLAVAVFVAAAAAEAAPAGSQPSGPPSSPGLVKDGGFEAASGGAALSGAWHGPSPTFARDDTVARAGRSSLRFHNTDPARYELCTQSVPLQGGAKYEFSAWIKTKDIAGDNDGATICLEWSGRDGKWMGGSYPGGVHGTTDWTRVVGVVRVPPQAASFHIACYGRPGVTGTAWFDEVAIVRVFDPPMRTLVTSPVYRGWLTADGPGEVRLLGRLNLADLDQPAEGLRLEASLRSRDGRVISRAEARPQAQAAELVLPAAGLKEGTYTAEVRLLDRQGKVIAQESHELRRLADDFRPLVRIDEHRRTLVAGKPFLPLGMYLGGIDEKDLRVLADSRLNCVMPYASPTRAQLDAARKAGLKVIYSVKDFYAGHSGCPAFIRTAADEEPAVRGRMKEFRDHPAVLAWYLNDELPQTYMDRLEAHQRWIAQDDPNHPTWVVLYQVDELADYGRTFDVIGTDPYPIGRQGASMAGRWARMTAAAFGGGRAAWMVPQVFNWANYEKAGPDPKLRSPTYEEMRSMAWQCLCEGATGLIFYSFYDLRRNADVPFDTQWGRLKKIVAEIDTLADVLLSVEPAGAARAEGGPWLHWMVRRWGGKTYVFCANDGDAEGEITVRMDRPVRHVVVRDGGHKPPTSPADKPPAVEGSTFRDRLPRLDVRVYEVELTP